MTTETNQPEVPDRPSALGPQEPRPPEGAARKGRSRRPPRPRTAPVALHTGTVTHLDGDQVFVEFGPKVHGVIAAEEFEALPEPGQQFQFSFVSIGADGVWSLSRSESRLQEIWAKIAVGDRVKARVIGENSGGLELKIGPVTAFLPASQISARGTAAKELFGQQIDCEVLEINRKRRRIIVSRRAVEQREQAEQRRHALEELEEGSVHHGKVVRLEPFGAIVDLGNGLSGLVHVSNISHQRVQRPHELLSVGQEVDVQVLEIKQGGKRIGLGMKQLREDPWAAALAKFPVNSRVPGKVTRLTEFGAFVQLEEGLEGLAHISQLSPERIGQAADAVKEGQEILVRVLSVDAERRRISLSRLSARGVLLGSEDDAAEEPEVRPEQMAPPPQRGTNLGAVLRAALERK